MRPTPRACPLGSAFPPETGDESPHSGRASGARGTGPAGGPPGCAPAFPEPRTRPAARGLPAPSGARFDVRGGGQTERQSRAEAEGGTSQICSGADILSRLRQRDWLVWRGRTAGGGWGEAGQSCGVRRPWRPWGPRPAVGTSSGCGAWDPERSTELLRAWVARVAGQQGPGRQGAGGRWSHRQDEVAVRGRCPRSRSSRQAFPVFRPLQPKPPACVAGAQEAPGAGLTANGDQGQAWPQVSGIPSPTVLLSVCLPVHLPVRPSIHLSRSLSLRTTRQPS